MRKRVPGRVPAVSRAETVPVASGGNYSRANRFATRALGAHIRLAPFIRLLHGTPGHGRTRQHPPATPETGARLTPETTGVDSNSPQRWGSRIPEPGARDSRRVYQPYQAHSQHLCLGGGGTKPTPSICAMETRSIHSTSVEGRDLWSAARGIKIIHF